VYISYSPDGGDKQIFRFDPNRIMSPEAEQIERKAGKPYGQAVADAQAGGITSRKAILWVLLRRQHPTLRYEDLNFAWADLELAYTVEELAEITDGLSGLDPDQLAVARAQVQSLATDALTEAQLSEATEGKAGAPNGA